MAERVSEAAWLNVAHVRKKIHGAAKLNLQVAKFCDSTCEDLEEPIAIIVSECPVLNPKPLVCNRF
jgi:hypothetical protein